MGRLVLAGVLVAAVAGIATAGPKRKVYIESDPPKAKVYLDDVDKPPACAETPCEITVPVGTSTLIIRKDQFEPEVAVLDVPRGKSTLKPPKYVLRGSSATVIVEAPKGASVRIDKEDQGTVPVRVSVSGGVEHHIIVTHLGKTVFDDVVPISAGDEFVVKPKTATAVASTTDDEVVTTDDVDEEETGGGGGGGSASQTSGGSVASVSDTKPRRAFLAAGVVADVGFRSFIYSGRNPAVTPRNGALRDLDLENGAYMLGPAVELWPGRLAGITGFLSNTSLFFRYQFSVYGPPVVDPSSMPRIMGSVNTKWGSWEASLRHRIKLGSFGIDLSPGFVNDTFTYVTGNPSNLEVLPDAAYPAFRIGAKLVYVGKAVEGYLAVENRIVFSGGPVAERLQAMENMASSINGLRGSLGLVYRLSDAFSARAEGTLQSYSWTFNGTQGNDPLATGASDSIKLISVLVGYTR